MPLAETTPAALNELLADRQRHVRATPLLIAANVAVFLAMLAGGAGLWHSSNSVQLAWGANFGPATQDGQWWRLGSALFLHFGVVHLALNMWALWDGGQLVERMYGTLRFTAIYFLAGLFGNLLSLVAHGGQAVSGGASGAVFGVYGALLVFLWNERRTLHPQDFRWLFWGAIGFAAATIVFGLLVTGIDNAAHVGGFAAGLCGAVIVRRPLDIRQRISWRQRLTAGAALVLAIGALVGNVPTPAYRWRDELSARREIVEFLRNDQDLRREWQRIFNESQRRGASFDELAGRIDSSIGDRYAASFDELAQLPNDPALPSGQTVDRLRDYAQEQRDATRALADGLRAKDAAQIRSALEQVQRSRAKSTAAPTR